MKLIKFQQYCRSQNCIRRHRKPKMVDITRGVAIGNVFLLEDWFFNNNIKVMGETVGPQMLSPTVSGCIVQGGGGNVSQPFSGMVIPGLSEKDTTQITSNGSTYLWNAEGGLINILYEYLDGNAGPATNTINYMKKYREQLVTEHDIKELKDSGVTNIRISLGWWIFQGEDGGDIDGYKIITDTYYDGSEKRPTVHQLQGGLHWIENILCKWIYKHGMKVIIDIHSAPGGSSYGVSYAGLPSVWDPVGKKYNWLGSVFFISKTCQNHFKNTIIPNALNFIRRVNQNYNNQIIAFEPMNEPGLGFYNIPIPPGFPKGDLVHYYTNPSNSDLGGYVEIFTSYQMCWELYHNYMVQYRNQFKTTQFWIQLYFGPDYAAYGFNGDIKTAWTDALNYLDGRTAPDNSTPGPNFLPKDRGGNPDWPDWLALDYHWYQTWDIPICQKKCCGFDTNNNNQCIPSQVPDSCGAGTDCYNCNMDSRGVATDTCTNYGISCSVTGDKNCCQTCNQSIQEYNKNGRVSIFETWIQDKLIGYLTQIHTWFSQYFPNRLPKNPNNPKDIYLHRLISCTEWAVATAPPRSPYLQCNDKTLINYFFKKQRDIYKKYGIINCYWTLKCPQAGNVKNPWSYQWCKNNGYITETG